VFHSNRLAANKHSSTDPDVTAVTVMLTTLYRAVDSTAGKPLTAGVAFLAHPLFDLDRFFAAIEPPLRDRASRPDPDASLSKLIFDRSPPSHAVRAKWLKQVVNGKWPTSMVYVFGMPSTRTNGAKSSSRRLAISANHELLRQLCIGFPVGGLLLGPSILGFGLGIWLRNRLI
jgi:hypothetical protein